MHASQPRIQRRRGVSAHILPHTTPLPPSELLLLLLLLRAQAELCPGGSGRTVRSAADAQRYAEALAHHKQVASIAAPAAAMHRGLVGILTAEAVHSLARCFSHAERNDLVAGWPQIDAGEWEAHARYERCTEHTAQMRWLWAAVGGMTPQRRRQLLAFVTGSSALPAGGFAVLRGFNGAPHAFTVRLVPTEGDERLPRASTCFNILHLPAYSTPAVLEARLAQAITGAQAFDEGEACVGCCCSAGPCGALCWAWCAAWGTFSDYAACLAFHAAQLRFDGVTHDQHWTA